MRKRETPSFLSNENLKLIIFGGKGGTGKTTCAAATAIYLAKNFPEKKIMVISTDPAHSLGDSFGCSLRAEKTLIEGLPNLWALELDPEKAFKYFKKKHARRMEEIVLSSSFFGQGSFDKFLSFSLPGMDEVMIYLQIASFFKVKFFESGRVEPKDADLIILDTAPTGHTLRLLSLPERMDEWLDLFVSSARRLSSSGASAPAETKRISGRGKRSGGKTVLKKPVEDFIGDFVKHIRRDLGFVSSILKNSQQCEFVPVTITEPMGILETQDILPALEKLQIPVKNIVINRMQKEGRCAFCSSEKKEQKKALAEIKGKFASYNLIEMPLFPYEIQGGKKLLTYAKTLSGNPFYYHGTKFAEFATKPKRVSTDNLRDILREELKFILFGGKGGVGKTSLSAATALYMAKLFPSKKVLIHSLDPAHSLADSFGFPIGDKITPVPGANNLFALETDGARLHHEFVEEIKEFMTNVFLLLNRIASLARDRTRLKRVMGPCEQAFSLGLGELMALGQVMDFAEKGEYDLCISDTAPTGHALTLLESPELIRDWLKFTYQTIKGNIPLSPKEVASLNDVILKPMTRLRKIRENLADSQRSGLVAITIPEAMGIAEAEDFLFTVDTLNISCKHIIVNMVVPPTQCSFCAPRRKGQLKYVEKLKERIPFDHLVAEIPLLPHQISGMDDLKELSEIMYGRRRVNGKGRDHRKKRCAQKRGRGKFGTRAKRGTG